MSHKSCTYKIFGLLIAIILLTNNIVLAGDTLAPETSLNDDDMTTLQQVYLICGKIEKEAANGSGEIGLGKIKDWFNSYRPETGFLNSNKFENVILFNHEDGKRLNECHIVVNSRFLIRYFDPTKDNLSSLFEGSHTIIHRSLISPTLEKQVYRIDPVVKPKTHIEDVFNHMIDKAGLQDLIRMSVASLGLDADQWHIAGLFPDGRFIIDEEFALDYYDIKRSRMGFAYTFQDGVTRWIDLADSVAYRTALHEFRLPGRQGHAYRGLEGMLAISRDEDKANIVGRRYSVVDDAMWLWFLHSYKLNDKARYDNNLFMTQINWIFSEADPDARLLAAEFPVLRADPEKRQEAIRLALLINKAFFPDRRSAGIDTKPAYEEWVTLPGKLRLDKATREEYMAKGPAADGYEEKGATLAQAMDKYLDSNADLLGAVAKEEGSRVLFRIPIEVLAAAGKENASLFLSALQKAPNFAVELYSAAANEEEVTGAYAYFGIERRSLAGPRTRKNTITLFVTDKDYQVKSDIDIMEKIGGGYSLKPTDTILMPVGSQDLSGLIRSTVFSISLLKMARGNADRAFIKDTLDRFKVLCRDSNARGGDGLNEEDIIGLASKDINAIIRSLNKMIKLLPITPIDTEILRKLYRNAAKILAAA